MYRYILFDMDGTLNDSMVGITESVKYSLASFGITADTQELLGFIGPPLRQSFRDFCGFDAETAEKAVAKYRERFSAIGVYENEVYPGIPELLKKLKEAGRVVVVASSKPENFVRIILDQHDITKYFDEIVGCRLDGTNESKPDIIREVFRRLSLTDTQKKECVMVGDRKFDLLGARECGIDFVGAGYGYAPEGELESFGAERIAADVRELEKILLEEGEKDMDKNTESVKNKMLERTAKALRYNHFEVYTVEKAADVAAKVAELMPEGSSAAVGGSMTLFETGVIDLLRNGKYRFLDRYKEDLTREEVAAVQREAFTADYFLCSSNAITEEGELYNVDGMGSRVAPMIFGPKNVIVVAGFNKIVPDLDSADERVRHTAAPANTARLGCKTPCAETGVCMDCHSPARICCDYVCMGFQREEGRVKVILVGEELGY